MAWYILVVYTYVYKIWYNHLYHLPHAIYHVHMIYTMVYTIMSPFLHLPQHPCPSSPPSATLFLLQLQRLTAFLLA
jgi:hypothetical protein